jgi:hypothetical protein
LSARWALAVALAAMLTWAPVAAATTPYTPKLPALLTPWTRSVSSTAPLPQYPRPQLQRADWLNLNGRWQYESFQGPARPPFGRRLAETILVPFPVSSPLSGINRIDTLGWYRRTFRVPSGWGQRRRVLLNFGAVSWAARVYVNGRLAGSHRGTYSSFSFDITDLIARGGVNELLVEYWDPIGGLGEPVGKQVAGAPGGAYHTASPGIWQTVWLEPVAAEHLTSLDSTPVLRTSRLIVSTATTSGPRDRIVVQALAGRRVVASASGRGGRSISLHLPHPRLWSPSDPYLYGLRVEVLAGGQAVDEVQSYFGMRSVSLGRAGGATRVLLNGRFVFETGALDQGFWPDGIYTAPTDAALRFDIDAAKRLGYNMVRKHEKVEPDRWYYWADRLGLLVWQDMPSLPIRADRAPTGAAKAEFRRELRSIVEQHRSDPAIVAWVGFNEGVGQFDLSGITREIKQLDRTRLVDTQSGSANCCAAIESAASDVRDTHLYFGPFAVPPDRRASVIGEYGGVLPWPPASHRWPGTPTSIGSPTVAMSPADALALLRRQYADLTQEMRVRGLSAAVFTELGAYEQETGIVSYDRRAFTLNPDVLRRLNTALLDASENDAELLPPAQAVPVGTTGLWHFDAGQGTWAGDASGHGHSLWLTAGASWTGGVRGTALRITQPGQAAMTTAPVIDTRRSFTVSAWLRASRDGQSGTAVSEPGTDGSSFSLGIATWTRSPQTRAGELASGKPAPPFRTWWTFMVPATPSCASEVCGVQANMHYDDGREGLRPGVWHQVTGVYDRSTRTVSVYVDGIPEEDEHTGPLPPARGPLTVGSGQLDYTPTDAFLGGIDELRTYRRALSPAEVWELYLAERPGTTR